MQAARFFFPSFFLLCAPLSGETLSLQEAIHKAMPSSTLVRSTQINTLSLKNQHELTGWIHNPEFSIEIENFLGTGAYRGIKSAEITYGLSQIFELGGKSAQRKELIKKNHQIAKLLDLDTKLDLVKDIMIAHAFAVYCQERLVSATEQQELASDLYKEVLLRVSRAREPLVQENKASIALFAARFDYEKAIRDLSLAKQALANLWNGHEESFLLDPNEFFQVQKPLQEMQMEDLLPKNPHMQVAEARIALAETQYKLEKSLGIVDLALNIGLKHHLENNNLSFVVGFSLPLPFFNRNQGPIEKARLEVTKAETDAQTERLKLVLSLHEWLKNIENAFSNAEILKNSIIPKALKSFSLSRQGYSLGKTPYYEVLDAQRTLSQVKEQYLSALKDYHVANAEIERLIAKHSDHPLVTEGGKHEK